jgi:hypothetical protein
MTSGRLPIDNWIICIPGFLQKKADAVEGIPALWHRLWERFHGRDVCVQMYPWNTNWSDVAEMIFRACDAGRVRIMVVAYSWGVGYGALRLLRELAYRGVRVAAAVFSDAVFHLWGRLAHLLGVSQVSAYLTRPWGRPQIALPGNEQELPETHWFVQDRKNFRWSDRNTWLRGHEIVWEATGEPVPGGIPIYHTTHRYMDECIQFQARTIEVANRLFAEAA